MNNIDEIKESLKNRLDELGCDERKSKFALYAIEEIILLYNADLNSVDFNVKRDKDELSVKLVIPGEEASIRELEETNNIYIFDKLIRKTNFYLKQEYIDKKNIIELTLEKYFNLFNNVKFVSRFLNSNKKDLFVGYFYNIIAIAINICIPIFTGKIILAYTNNTFNQVVYMATAIFIARILYLFFISKATIYYNIVSFDLSNTLQTSLLKKLFSITDEALENNGTGQFIKRINSDVNEIAVDITSLFNMVSNGIYYLGILIISLTYNVVVFFAELITFIGLYFLENYRVKVLDVNRRKVLKADEVHSSLVIEQINGATEIKLLNAANHFIEKTKMTADNVAQLSKESNKSKTKLSFINNSYIYFCYLLIMIYLGYAIKQNTISIPDSLILFNFFTLISTPLVALVQRFMNFKKTFSIACERCYNLLEGNEFNKEISGNYLLNDVTGEIKFKNVTFAYETEDNKKPTKVLKNVSFKIEPNKTTAIVGRSGEGKSTILKLITGQRNCLLGTIEIDGIDILKINKESLRNNMSVISQSPFFFNASIKDNLLLAKPDASEKELIEACKNAYIYDDIIKTENGFDTIIHEKGVRFSGGQRQRLAIARALLTNNKILIFDEATSALDNIAQEKIMKAIKNIGKDHTIILVAHRLSSIINSDKILMISKGKIIAEGTHKELMKNSEEYKELYTTE